jgi:hypothetical protein
MQSLQRGLQAPMDVMLQMQVDKQCLAAHLMHQT